MHLTSTNTAFTLECPEGYSYHAFTVAYAEPQCGCWSPCRIYVEVCCKWDPVNHSMLVSDVEWSISSLDICCFLIGIQNWEAEKIAWLIHKKLANTCIGQYPPCDHPTLNYYEVVIKSATCIYYENKFMPPYPGEEAMWLLRARNCGNGKCVSTYRVCLDYNYSPPTPSSQLISRTVENAYCPMNARPTLPPQGKSWEEQWSTDCFLLLCNE